MIDRLVLRLAQSYGVAGLPLFVLVTVLCACALSFAVGLERELHGEPTGLSTHVLIAVSCCLLMTMSVWAPRIADGYFDLTGEAGRDVNYDTSRIAAAIVSGVGFLGAGTIIKTGPNVKGLSTAATVWSSAAIGMACGAGLLLEALIVTVITMAVLMLSIRVKRMIVNRLPCLKVAVRGEAPVVAVIMRLASANGMIVREIEAPPFEPDEPVTEINVLFAYKTTDILILDLGRSLLREGNVLYVECNGIRLP